MARRENEFDKEIAAWFETLKKPTTPEEQAEVDQIIDKMIGLHPRVSSERVRSAHEDRTRSDIYKREDVLATNIAISKELDKGKLSISALTAWRRHLFANSNGVSPSNELLLDLPPIPGADSDLLARTHIDGDQQLGPKIDSVLFTGNHLHSITLDRASLQTPQATHRVLSANLRDLQRLVSQKPGFGYRVTRRG